MIGPPVLLLDLDGTLSDNYTGIASLRSSSPQYVHNAFKRFSQSYLWIYIWSKLEVISFCA